MNYRAALLLDGPANPTGNEYFYPLGQLGEGVEHPPEIIRVEYLRPFVTPPAQNQKPLPKTSETAWYRFAWFNREGAPCYRFMG